MDEVIELYNKKKLIVRATDVPERYAIRGKLKYNCSTWANEFAQMMNDDFDSVSCTLLIPGVGVRTYKDVGFLVNSDKAIIEHIASSDSISSGRVKNGTFGAIKSDYNTIEELANYIERSGSTIMNEVNLGIPFNAVVGLVFNKCDKIFKIKKMIIVRECLYRLCDIYYDLYEYDNKVGKIRRFDITDDLIDELFSNPNDITDFSYSTDYMDEIENGNILSGKEFTR